MSPRRNTIGHSRRRTTRRPDLEPVDQPVSFDALALDLVSRGLAGKSILDQPAPPPKENQP